MQAYKTTIALSLSACLALIIGFWPQTKTPKKSAKPMTVHAKQVIRKNYNKQGLLTSIIQADAVSKQGDSLRFKHPKLKAHEPDWNINADSGQAYGKSKIVLNGKIHIQRQNLTITADHAVCHLIDRKIQHVILTANSRVRVKSKLTTASAKQIDFFPKTQQIILRGDAQIQQHSNRMRAHEIHYNLKNKTITTKKQATEILINRDMVKPT